MYGTLPICFKLADVASGFYLFFALGFQDLTQLYVLNPLQSVFKQFNQSFICYLLCPLWATFRISLFCWRFHIRLKKLKQKRAKLIEVHTSMAAKLRGLKSPLENVGNVIGLRLSQIRQKVVHQKYLTTLDTVEAFQVYALNLIANENAGVAEIIFDADVTAILADHSLQSDEQLTPLHGIPVSLANIISVKGEDCTGSLVFRSAHNADHDAGITKSLKKAGAIPMLLSNTSILPCQSSTSNKLYGNCAHPTHLDRAVGGACGGEAVLLINSGSVLGFGVDIFGDVRIPAAFCGVVGFKPTSQRLSNQGIFPSIRAPFFLPPTVSPLAKYVDDIHDVFRSLCVESVQSEDPSIPIIPYPLSSPLRKLVIGMYKSLPEILPAVPAVRRCLEEVKVRLEKQGHKVVEFCPPEPEKALYLTLSYLAKDDSYWQLIVNENLGDTLSVHEILMCGLPKIPYFLRFALTRIFKIHQGASCANIQMMLDAWRKQLPIGQLEAQVEHFRSQFREQWEEEGIDALVGPAGPSPALKRNSSLALTLANIGYNIIYNLLDLPAGVLPVGKVTKEDVMAAEVIAKGVSSSSLYRQLLSQQKGTEGLPLAIQVIAKPWKEDVALQVMSIVEVV